MYIDIKKMDGFSLIEMLVTLVIISIIIGVISTQFPMLHKLVNRYADQVLFKENYLVFLAVISKDFHESENYKQQSIKNDDIIYFDLDMNFDADYEDSAEKIAYRWNRQKNRIDRKSGKGSFQAILDGVEGVIWDLKKNNAGICIQITIKSVFSEKNQNSVFCRPSFIN